MKNTRNSDVLGFGAGVYRTFRVFGSPRKGMEFALLALVLVGMFACGGSEGEGALFSGDEEVDAADGEVVAQFDPNTDGPFVFDREDVPVRVEGEERMVDIDLVVMSPEGEGPFPLVLFTHGFMLSPELFLSFGERLASWGFVVVMPQMPGSLTSPETHRDQAEYLAAILDWVTGEASGALQDKVDAERIGVAGHSMGGKLSFLLASTDLRVKAVFGVDPVDSGPPTGSVSEDYPSVTPEKMADIRVPFVALGETVNGGEGSTACAPTADNFEQYFEHAQSPALKIEVIGANHMSFLDDPDCGLLCAVCPLGTDNPTVTRALTLKYMTAFFLVTLENHSELYEYLSGTFMQKDIEEGRVLTQAKNGFGED